MNGEMPTRAARTRELVAALENPRWGELLTKQIESKPEDLVSNYYRLSSDVSKLQPAEIALSLTDTERLLELGLTGYFPETEHVEHPRRTILHFLQSIVQPSFARVIETHFGQASAWNRCLALGILCKLPDGNAFETFIRLLETCPDSPIPFRDLADRHWIEVRRLLPRLLVAAHIPDYLASLMNVIHKELEQGRVEPAALAPAATHVQSEAQRLLLAVETQQQSSGTEWRLKEAYSEMSVPLGVYVDLLGVIPSASPEVLDRAQQLNDPRLILLAVVSLLKKRVEPKAAAVRRCASSHAVRDDLYRQLSLLGRVDLFPPEYTNLESFAACDMVRWLMFPSELGYEPEQLQLMAKVTSTSDEGNEACTFLWRCTPSDGPAFSCVNGPFLMNEEMGKLTGDGYAFSNFTAWDEATPEEHLAQIVDTLEKWHVSWCNDRS